MIVPQELPNYDQGEYIPGDQSMEPFTVLEVNLIRQVSGFGFRIIGGREEGSQVWTGPGDVHIASLYMYV